MYGGTEPTSRGSSKPYAISAGRSETDRLRERDERSRAALDAFGIATFRWSIESHRLDADDGMDRIIGGEAGGCPHTIEDLLATAHEGDRPRLATALERCANDEEELREEVRIYRADGALRRIELRGRVVPGVGHPFIGACLDVTERWQRDRDKAELVAVLSHELRTPLNAIGGYASLLLDGIPTPLPAPQADYARRIKTAYQHVIDLLDALLTHAKAAAGKIEYRVQNVPVGEVLDHIEPLTAPQRAARGLAYDCTGCDPAMVLRADRGKVEQILLNLVSNAVKFTPPGGRIALATERVGIGRGAIEVRDTGVGLDPEQLRLAFEAYTQFVHRTNTEREGTGLGLSISRDLARGMGGDLTADSAPGRGSVFRLTLPLG